MTDALKNQTLSDAVGKLAGRILSSVTFVADYVQLGFNGPGLTAYTIPTVRLGSEIYSWGQPRFRDALCEQIGCLVKDTRVDDVQLSIDFDNGASLSISLRDDDYTGPEALECSLDKERSWVV